MEADLELVGVTAIEDKLQDGVPAAIQTLLDAGMKVPVHSQPFQRTHTKRDFRGVSPSANHVVIGVLTVTKLEIASGLGIL